MENMEGKERKRQRDEDDAIELKASKAKEWKHDWEVCKAKGRHYKYTVVTREWQRTYLDSFVPCGDSSWEDLGPRGVPLGRAAIIGATFSLFSRQLKRAEWTAGGAFRKVARKRRLSLEWDYSNHQN